MSRILLAVRFNEVLRMIEKCDCPHRLELLEKEFHQVERKLINYARNQQKEKGVQHK